MKIKKFPLLLQVVIAITLGIGCGYIFPDWLSAIFATFNSLFGNFLSFIVPLIIVGLVSPAIAEIGRGAGRMLLITALLAYAMTVFSGLFAYISCDAILPHIVENTQSMTLSNDAGNLVEPYFNIEMPPLFGVVSALVLSFILGMGMTLIGGRTLLGVANDFRDIILKVIERVIIPLLPIYIFGIFLSITIKGEVASIIGVFMKIIVVLFILTALLLLIQFTIAGAISRRNPLKMLRSMLPAYATALGTQSSAATIPVTLKQTIAFGVSPSVAGFVVPLCATIHLSGSTLKIVACSMAIMLSQGLTLSSMEYIGFIMMLGIAMVAAPGVPGGAIMAALGLLQSSLGFDETSLALMIALYIAMDSFGTACNVTGDGAIAAIVERFSKKIN